MRAEAVRGVPVVPPVTGVVLHLTVDEAETLFAVANTNIVVAAAMSKWYADNGGGYSAKDPGQQKAQETLGRLYSALGRALGEP